MKFRPTIASIFRGEQAAGQVATSGAKPLSWLLRSRTARFAGVAALAAGITTATLLPHSGSSASTSSPGTAPQLHVFGNQLVSSTGQRTVLRGVDRSGTEFMCVQNRGIFDGPSNAASIRAIKAHGFNAVRVPLNEACWNGDSYVNRAYAGATYRKAVTGYVRRLNANGLVAIVDLHWTNGTYTGPASACSSAQAVCQKPMPDAAGAVPFWRSVATTFKGNDAVVFDLFNEPYPEYADHNIPAAGWRCWLHGGNCVGFSYNVAGMQTMVNAVRSTGANNVLMLGGLTWSNDLTQWLSHKPVDPSNNLAASWHSYNFNGCSTKGCWNSQIAPVLHKVPVIAGEIGENDCAGSYVNRLMSWMDSHGGSYLAWTWNSDFNCATGPGLITSYNGNPTGFGAAVEAHMKAIGHPAGTLTAGQSVP